MRKLSALLIISVLLLSAVAVASAGNQQERVRVFLEFKGEPDASSVHLASGKVLHSYSLLKNTLAVEIPEASLNGLLMNPNVVGYELDAEVHTLAPPGACSPWPECKNGGDDDDASTQPPQELPWGVDRIDADLANGTGAGVTVCVVDTGIDKDHPDLVDNLAGGINFVTKPSWKAPDDKWDDDNGHGTHVAGTVAAIDNTIGVVGVAPHASLLAAKVLDRQGSGYLSDVIAGIDWCVQNGVEVVSMSLGTSSDSQTLHDAVDAAYGAGSLLVAAAGNSGDGDGSTNDVSYPAKYSSVVAVSATAQDDSTPSWSSEGVEVELAAPGVDVLSTWNDGMYNTISGTSMATPHVSAVAALAWEANPGMSNADVRSLLQSTADDLGTTGHDNFYGHGLVDAEFN